MGQNFQFLNITREERGGAGGEFLEFIYTNLDAIQYALSRPRFPEQTPENLLGPDLPRSHLGTLSSLPAELIDEIFEQLFLPVHVARFAATHPILFAQGFARIVQIRTQNMNRITWYKNRVALVGDYLERLGLDGLLSESGKLRADMDRFQQRLISENVEPNREWDNDPLGLFEFADYYGQFTKTNATRDGPREVLWDREYRAQKEEDREVLGEDQYYDYDTDIDEERIDRISDRARPIFPPYKTAVLCNLTKRQFVRSEMVLKFQWRDPEEKLIDTRSVPYTGLFPRPELHELYPDHLTLGATVFFLTIITDDWGFNLRFVEKEDPVGQGPGLVMGRWAGDCLAVVEPDEVEEDMLDISEEVVAMVRRFVEA